MGKELPDREEAVCSSWELLFSHTPSNFWSPTRLCIGTCSIDDSISTLHLIHYLNYMSSFISPYLECASAAWDPFLKKDTDLIEDVQNSSLKICLKSWNASYADLLVQSNLPSLRARRRDAKLCHLYKIVNSVTFFPNAPTLTRHVPYSSHSVHPKAIIHLQAHSSQYLFSFLPSTIVAWNSLPSDTVSAPTITFFSQH